MKKNEFLLLLDELIEANPNTLKGSEVLHDLEGWDSFAAMQFIALADDQFDVAISAKRLAECQTIDNLIEMLNGHVQG